MPSPVPDSKSASDVVETENLGTSTYSNADEKAPVHGRIHNEEMGYNFSSDQLPKNYYRSLYFMGTMLACGSAFASVRLESVLLQDMMITSMGADTNDRASVASPSLLLSSQSSMPILDPAR